jgi:hypothetical protein
MNSLINPSQVVSDAQNLVLELTNQVELHHPGLLATHSVSQYLSLLDDLPVLGWYHCISPDIEVFCRNVAAGYGIQGLGRFHQLVLAKLILKIDGEINSMAIDQEIIKLFCQNFTRIKKFMASNPPEFYQHSNDKFSKDLAACMLRLMPMGAQKIILNGIPRSDVVKSGGLNAVKSIAYILSEVGGFKPLYEMHTDEYDMALLREFSPEGWDRCYLRIASMLESNPDVKGVFGISWFFDPQLEKISPRLNFLRERPLNNGGQIFFISHDKKGVGGALVRSTTRQKLFSKGQYIPANYLMIWPRKYLISWANRFKKYGDYSQLKKFGVNV